MSQVGSLTLQWRHIGPDGVSNHQRIDRALRRLFRHRSKKTSKLRVTGLCEGNSPVTGEFPAQRPVTPKMYSFDDVIMSLRKDDVTTAEQSKHTILYFDGILYGISSGLSSHLLTLWCVFFSFVCASLISVGWVQIASDQFHPMTFAAVITSSSGLDTGPILYVLYLYSV